MSGLIKVGNFAHKLGRPFALLRGLDFVEYAENGISENVLRLQEGALDVALISTTDFASHGGYVGLNFGLGVSSFSRRVMLYARSELHKLRTVYVHDDCSSMVLLLKLLLTEKWSAGPRLLHIPPPARLDEHEGVLVMHEHAGETPHGAECWIAEDIMELWREMCGLPFVALIWAARPGVLTLRQHKLFNEMFHFCEKAQKCLTSALIEPAPDSASMHYYLDEEMMEGLNHFYGLCAKRNLLPATRYSHASYAPFDRGPRICHRERSVQELLQESIEGRRLSVREGIRLAAEADIADLGLAADLLRRVRRSSSSLHRSGVTCSGSSGWACSTISSTWAGTPCS